jgi:hypothetical protein
MNYTDKKILYVWRHDVSLGDSLTNFHDQLSWIKKMHPRSVIYTIVHHRTYNTDVCSLLLNKGIIDFVYPIHVDNINSEEYKSFLYILQNVNFDVVIHNNHSTAECVSNIKSLFPRSLHIQSNFSNFGLTTYYDYVGTFDGDPRNGTVLRTSYSKNYVEDFINDVISLAGDKKTVAIFAGSTRKLANLHTVGLKKIIDTANECGFFPYLVGSKNFNPYNEFGINWKEIYNQEYENCCNLLGNNWIKTIEFLKKVNCVISSPTGASMIPPLIEKKMLLLNGGDTSIMSDCLHNYTNVKNVKLSVCDCINYPCGSTDKTNPDTSKYNNCNSNSNPICLNEELDLESIKNFLNET